MLDILKNIWEKLVGMGEILKSIGEAIRAIAGWALEGIRDLVLWIIRWIMGRI